MSQCKITVTAESVIIESATGAPVIISKIKMRRALDQYTQKKHGERVAQRRFARSEGWVD